MRISRALLALATLFALLSPLSTAEAAPVPKKGVSTWYMNGVTQALQDSRVSWYYNWDSGRAGIASPAGVEFVPMIWGPNHVTDQRLNEAKNSGTTLLGFNEPDLAGQSNMTVDQALNLWPRLQATGMRLGSPAVAYGGDRAGGWLDRFLAGARARGYRVDFITLHWYGSDFSDAAVGHLKSYVDAVWNKYRVKIWLTEFSLIDWSTGTARYPTQAQLARFATNSGAMLNAHPAVERYAWFALPTDRSGTGLYHGATPNEVGRAYRAIG
ncbi:glycoside hydrolase family protein [Kribbella sp. CA-293567]|uniref:glycoside hydrolase family protein n=1 Tax=Kribbella sp. CA-293567 TaxID=3002436 RepID=UPI0022DD1F50|nr:glycoside hydrolase family protein [Kribbella sp. CA-293567]WBQ06408.1 glycoside hydrolase family protein [Kribbella sp. CA-293567]